MPEQTIRFEIRFEFFVTEAIPSVWFKCLNHVREPGIVKKHQAVVTNLEVVQICYLKLQGVVKIAQIVRGDVAGFQDFRG